MTTTNATEIANPLQRLSKEQLEELAKEFDAIHDEVYDDLGDEDAKYIRSVIEYRVKIDRATEFADLQKQFAAELRKAGGTRNRYGRNASANTSGTDFSVNSKLVNG